MGAAVTMTLRAADHTAGGALVWPAAECI